MHRTLPDNLGQYLTVTRAARLLGVSADTLRNWDKSGQLKAYRHPLNGYRLYRKEDLAALLRSIRDTSSRGESRDE